MKRNKKQTPLAPLIKGAISLFLFFLFVWIPGSLRLPGMIQNAFAALIPCSDGTQADATVGCTKTPPNIIDPQSGLVEWILKIATGLSAVVGVAAVAGAVVSGIQYAAAAGDEEKIQKAKRTLFWSVFGLMLALLAYAVVSMIGNLLI